MKKELMEMNKKIEVTDVKKLLGEKVPYYPLEVTELYGIAYQLKKFSGMDMEIPLNKCTIEHGFFRTRDVCYWEVKHHVSHILTFSPFREEVIKELTDITPIAIGPYIAYAEDYRSPQYMKKIKRKIGRTLLVMPSHSLPGANADYNVEQFIRQIETARECFDTVIVCMHVEDIRNGKWKPYRKKGYHMVSCGNIFSLYFLSRLKHIICLSDALIVNGITTGMAYAMYMNRPIRLVRQQIKRNLSINNNFTELELEDYGEKICDMFDQREFVITKEQREFGKYMFGLDHVRPKHEMRELLLSLSRTTGAV